MIRGWLTLVALAVWLPPAPCSAALLPVDAKIQFVIPFAPVVTLTGSGLGGSVGGGVATIPAGIFSGNQAIVVPISPTLNGLLSSVTVPANSIANAAGSFGPNGAMGLSGAIFFYGEVGTGWIPLAPIGGGGGALAALVLNGSLNGATWMGGTAIFTSMGISVAFGKGVTARATSYDNRTAGGAGTIQLVAPARWWHEPLGSTPAFGILTLTYTPEPGTLTLLGAGVVALAMIGRRKQEERS
jgi:hypothetical protein